MASDMTLKRLRDNARTRGTALVLVALFSVAVAAPGCVMGVSAPLDMPSMPAMADHDCPHCPPELSCEEALRNDCESPQPLIPTRGEEPVKLQVLAAAASFTETLVMPPWAEFRLQPDHSPPRWSRPRPHLLHAQFNE